MNIFLFLKASNCSYSAYINYIAQYGTYFSYINKMAFKEISYLTYEG
jgi:hypothetical protein